MKVKFWNPVQAFLSYKIKKKAEEHVRGYLYARCRLRNEGDAAILELEMRSDNPWEYPNPFDDGIRQALREQCAKPSTLAPTAPQITLLDPPREA